MAHEYGEEDGVLEATLDMDNEAVIAGEDFGVMGLDFFDAARSPLLFAALLLVLDIAGCMAIYSVVRLYWESQLAWDLLSVKTWSSALMDA